MKKIKKITAIVLATVMMFAMSIPTFAADNNTSVDETVSANADNVNRFYERWKSIGNNYAVVTGNDLKNPTVMVHLLMKLDKLVIMVFYIRLTV